MSMELWTAATPNGWKVTIMVEELIESGVVLPELHVRTINLSAGEQFTAEFTDPEPQPEDPRVDRRRHPDHGELRDSAVPGREVSD